MTDPPPRAQLLRQAETLVCGDRNRDYGPPAEDWGRAATMWTALFGRTFTAHEVAMAMVCIKLSRIAHTPNHYDSWVDAAGYLAGGWECAAR